jgi:hypothetical protein
MSYLPSAALEVARRQHGVVTADQLGAHAISTYRRRRLVEEAVLVMVHPGVYRLASAPETLESRCAAPCLAVPGLVISGTTAARLLNVRRMSGDDIHAMTDGHAVHLDGVVVHRTNNLHPVHDVVVREDSIRLLAVPRLVFDLARFLDDDTLESVIEQLLQRSSTNIPRLFAVGRRLRKQGRDGTARFSRVLGRRPLWAKPKHSDHEVRLLRALRGRGIDLVPQLPLTLPGGQRIHLDGGDPSRSFGVEVDHVTWHGGRVGGQHDKWRDRQCGRIGWHVSRVTDEDVDKRLLSTVDDLVEIYNRRAVA